jgi:hypothetical protein
MALDYFVTKFYKFPFVEKQVLKDFFLSDEIDKWGAFTLLVPTMDKKDILLLVTVNNLSIFDRIEDYLLAVEIEGGEYLQAAKWWGTQYTTFYPSANISDLSA